MPTPYNKSVQRVPIRIEISARHVHLTAAHIAVLFGSSYTLRPLHPLSQRDEFASTATVTLRTKGGEIQGVRVLGPARAYTQVELAATDARRLGLTPPVRRSGNLAGTPGVTIVGPRGTLKLRSGVILQRRHLHLSDQEAKKLGIRDGQRVAVQVAGPRKLIFQEVEVKVQPTFRKSLHLDTDEGNAAGITKKVKGNLLCAFSL